MTRCLIRPCGGGNRSRPTMRCSVKSRWSYYSWPRCSLYSSNKMITPYVALTVVHIDSSMMAKLSSKSCSPSGPSTANTFLPSTASCISVMASASSVTEATSMVRFAQLLDSSYIWFVVIQASVDFCKQSSKQREWDACVGRWRTFACMWLVVH